MKIGRQQQQQAANDGHLSIDQAEALYRYLKHQPGKVPNLNFTHILYYLGRLITISAMTLFMNLGWEEFGGWGALAISMAYAVTGLVKWQWIYLEFGTLIAGAIMAWRYHYPFVVMPIVVTLWYMSMDMEDMLSGGNADYEFKVFVSMWFCLLTTLVAFWFDIRSRHTGDYAFWLYLSGVLAFWCSLTMQHSDGELAKFICMLTNLDLIGIGTMLVHRVIVVFGALGCADYLGHLASSIFQDSWRFPTALTTIGLGIIYLGIL